MKIEFSKVLKDLSGNTIKDSKGDVTLRFVSTEALLAAHTDDNASGQEKYSRYELARKIQSDEADLTTEEVSKIKMLIGKTYFPIVVGPAFDALEGK